VNYKIKIIYRDGTTHEFQLEDYEIARITYERYCLRFADHASALEGEWIVAMLREDNTIIKQLKLTSTL